ncbi:hypothetical protein DAEQUDRAFT_761453 [Daedalea quercina L-15889]|uniref:Uncharacterized protein n=1 Tax=Daedalea quercina L-15889 TaxID=1314783 RepID=A0A165TUT4_9APHY|nr:hypothetical protein DAEQUDRAFT_761453 [Daedalea quercina L-15889]
MPTLPTSELLAILDTFAQAEVTIPRFVVSVLQSNQLTCQEATDGIVRDIDQLLHGLCEHACVRQSLHECIHRLVKAMYMDELRAVSKKDAGMHFNARRATAGDLEDFDVVKLSERIDTLAPHVSDLFDSLLDADPVLAQRRAWHRRRRRRRRAQMRQHAPVGTAAESNTDGAPETERDVPAAVLDDSDEERWAQLPQIGIDNDVAVLLDAPEQLDADVEMIDAGEIELDNNELDDNADDEDEYCSGLEPLLEDPDDPESATDMLKEEERDKSIQKMKRALCLSMMAQSTNQ